MAVELCVACQMGGHWTWKGRTLVWRLGLGKVRVRARASVVRRVRFSPVKVVLSIVLLSTLTASWIASSNVISTCTKRASSRFPSKDKGPSPGANVEGPITIRVQG